MVRSARSSEAIIRFAFRNTAPVRIARRIRASVRSADEKLVFRHLALRKLDPLRFAPWKVASLSVDLSQTEPGASMSLNELWGNELPSARALVIVARSKTTRPPCAS